MSPFSVTMSSLETLSKSRSNSFHSLLITCKLSGQIQILLFLIAHTNFTPNKFSSKHRTHTHLSFKAANSSFHLVPSTFSTRTRASLLRGWRRSILFSRAFTLQRISLIFPSSESMVACMSTVWNLKRESVRESSEILFSLKFNQ